MTHNQKTQWASAILQQPELSVCLSGVCQPPTASFGLIASCLIDGDTVICLICILCFTAMMYYPSFLLPMCGELHRDLFMVNVKCLSLINAYNWCIIRKKMLQSRYAVCSSWMSSRKSSVSFVLPRFEVSQTVGEIVRASSRKSPEEETRRQAGI